MQKPYILIVLGMLLIGTVVAGTVAASDFYKKIAPSSCEEFLSGNAYIWLPESVSGLFFKDTIILHFSMVSGNEITMNGVVVKGMIAGLDCGRTGDYDYEVWMSDINALELATSEKPISTFVRLWKSGEIRIEANGSDNEQKLGHADRLVESDDEPVPEKIREYFGKFLDII